MSKSLGNLVFVEDLIERSEASAVRLALLGQHYRQDWSWRDAMLDTAVARLATWRRVDGDDERVLEAVRRHLDNDLDTPGALSAIDDAVSQGRGVRSGAALLGIGV
jgi:L-cysteine:1D-myo-inositol 2-amino-2-deoxy-alpha-D-glucopyranoside ligase